jgi:hypothetical protein
MARLDFKPLGDPKVAHLRPSVPAASVLEALITTSSCKLPWSLPCAA